LKTKPADTRALLLRKIDAEIAGHIARSRSESSGVEDERGLASGARSQGLQPAPAFGLADAVTDAVDADAAGVDGRLNNSFITASLLSRNAPSCGTYKRFARSIPRFIVRM